MGYGPCQAPVSAVAQSLGVEAMHVSSTRVVLVCGFGVENAVQHVWDNPDMHPDVIVLKT